MDKDIAGDAVPAATAGTFGEDQVLNGLGPCDIVTFQIDPARLQAAAEPGKEGCLFFGRKMVEGLEGDTIMMVE